MRIIGLVSIKMLLISGSALAQWTTSGDHLYNSNKGIVGIGTNAPDAKLHITIPENTLGLKVGSSKYGFSFGDASLSLKGYTGSIALPYIEWVAPNGKRQAYMGWHKDYFNLTLENDYRFYINGGDMQLGMGKTLYVSDRIQFVGASGWSHHQFKQTYVSGTSGNTNLCLRRYTGAGADGFENGDMVTFTYDGNVGIGTSSPSATLHVNGRTYIQSPSFRVGYTAADDSSPSLTGIHLENRRAGGTVKTWTLYTAAIGGGYGVRPNAFEIWEYPETKSRFIILPGGTTILGPNGESVGIGTTQTGSYKLAVEGKIACRSELRVFDPGVVFPDYVFDKNYDLRSLDEVKHYIQTYQHLPDVPSAQEIAQEGVELAKMNALLLKKIEELTLYLIQQENKINELEKNIKK